MAAPGLSYSTWDLHCIMHDLSLQCAGSLLWHAGFSLVAAHGLLSSCGMWVFLSLVVMRRLWSAWAL